MSHDGRVVPEERRQGLAIGVGRTVTSDSGDEPLEGHAATATEGEPACLDGVNQAVEKGVEIERRKTRGQFGSHQKAQLTEFARAFFLPETATHSSGRGLRGGVLMARETDVRQDISTPSDQGRHEEIDG